MNDQPIDHATIIAQPWILHLLCFGIGYGLDKILPWHFFFWEGYPRIILGYLFVLLSFLLGFFATRALSRHHTP